jgi:RimJ/RimL family protein N-acetyltransferase
MFRWLVAADARRHDRRIWAILPAERPESCLGLVELYDLDPQARRAVLGIVIGEKERWGQGLGSVAVELVCEFGFNALALEEIHLSTYAHNTRARRCFAHAGFIEAGRGPGPGGREDMHMRLERARWLDLNSRLPGRARAS